MMMRSIVVAMLMLSCLAGFPAETWGWTLQVTFPSSIRSTPFTGRVTVFFSAAAAGEPRLGPDWFRPEPFVSLDVVDWSPGMPLTIAHDTPGLLTFPKGQSVDTAKYKRAQVVARFDRWSREVGRGAGNGYSPVVEFTADAHQTPLAVTLDRVVPERKFKESSVARLCEVPSPLLTAFYGFPVSVKAGVVLPASYATSPERRYPVIFTIPGFGGTHFSAERTEPIAESNPGGVEFLRVMLDPSCPWGHHVFADSANNGPWGTALVTEWLPEFERRFRVAKNGRFLTGHSSGGWSSLWLQISHPEVFDGVWSTAPDSVDFRDFQQANIYREGENAWVDPEGNRRPIAHRGAQVLVWWDDFDHMEQVLGPGGQFQSFEAVFSRRAANGRPEPLWNRETGAIDCVAAVAWRRFDIRHYIDAHWDRLREPLAGKLHVFMGSEDTFYLTGATVKLRDSLQQLGSDAVVEIHEGKDHSSLFDAALRDRIRTEMAERFLATR